MLGSVPLACAHEIRPAYLQIDEIAPGRYQLLWRTPVLSGMRLPVVVQLPTTVRNVTEPAVHEFSDAVAERRLVEFASGTIEGSRIDFIGLQATITDVLVRIVMADGTQRTFLVHPSQPWLAVAAQPSRFDVATTYLRLGIEHILGGVDHLLFVLALLLLVKGWRRVLLTVTAFTVAHSLTLAAAALGFVHVPQKPIEACIALSIMFVAAEIIYAGRGRSGLTLRAPWIVAFTFGLLHGFGFAGALSEVGLPQHAIPVALLFFNLGVEVGQLFFIAAVFLLFTAQMRASQQLRGLFAWIQRAAPYAVGGIAAFWVVQRVAAF